MRNLFSGKERLQDMVGRGKETDRDGTIEAACRYSMSPESVRGFGTYAKSTG